MCPSFNIGEVIKRGGNMDVRFFSKSVSELTDKNLGEMYFLFEKYYVDISYELFLHDLKEKTHVLFVRNVKNELVGFSTLFRKKNHSIAKGTFLYSGDTVIRQDYWGTKYLQKAFFYFILRTKLASPFQPVYWMLISKGFKTYMMMKRNFISCWPRREGVTPVHLKEVQNAFYKMKFGSSYKKDLDLIVFEESKGTVKGDIASPSDEDKADMDIQFFLERNPKYSEGVELACLAEILWKDLMFHVLKYFVPSKYEKKVYQIYENYRSRRASIASNS
jgi:hypothetical protein